MTFAETFNGYQAHIGEIALFVSKSSIATVFDLAIEGEWWFKKAKVDENTLSKFLKP